MKSDQFKKLMKSLKGIEKKLDILVRLQKASMPKQKLTPSEREILKFCDKKHTADDIVKEAGKTKSVTENLLSDLRKKGQIVSVRVKGKVVYERI